MLRQLMQRVPESLRSPLKPGYLAIRREVRYRRRIWTDYSTVRRSDLRLLTTPMLFRAKRSHTLFILGTGSSTNQFTTSQWRQIAAADSLGMNAWILHEHVPTFYSGEFPSPGVETEVYRHNLRVAAPRYRNCVSFFRLFRAVLENSDILRDFGARVAMQEPIGATGIPHFRQRIERYDLLRRGFLTRVLHQGSSVDTAVMLAAFLRYKRVVLCGVDLNNVRYFYEESPERFAAAGYRIPDSEQVATVHRSNDPTQTPSGVPVSAVLNRLRSHPSVPELFVALPGSALYPDLPVYPWEVQ